MGVYWNKQNDTLGVDFKSYKEHTCSELTNYDSLGVASPILLIAKQLYREISEKNITQDKTLPKDIEMKWLHYQMQ